MIDKVVICGIRRGNQLISSNEIQQCCGRAGRSYTESGEAILLVPSDDYIKAQDKMFGKMPPIESVMDEVDNAAFQVLPMILKQQVYDESTFYIWFDKTLAKTQGKMVKYDDIIEYLKENECIAFFDNHVVVNELGEISSKFYYSPERVKKLKDNLIDIFESNQLYDSIALSWLFANDRVVVGNADEIALGEYKSKLHSLGYSFQHGELCHGYVFYCLLNGLRPKWLKYVINGEYDDFDRLINALKRIAFLMKYNIEKELDIICLSVKKRVTIEVASKMYEFGINQKGNILELLDFGINNQDDLIRKREIIREYGSEKLNKTLDDKGYKEDEIEDNH